MLHSLILTSIILLSITFPILNHPLSMTIFLMMKTMLISFLSGLLTKSFWFSYSLFLIFLGGMLILVMYMTSIASNEKFNLKLNSNFLFFFLIMSTFLTLLLISNKKYLIINQILSLDNSATMMTYIKLLFFENNFMLSKMYNFPMNFITIMLICFLLLTLVAVVKITNIQKGPMRAQKK